MFTPPHPTRVASCLAAALAFAPAAQASTRTVTNCSDSGTGSLRSAIASASATGDTIVFDMAQMACSKITLSSGQIVINAQAITIQGPGAALLAVSGNNILTASRVFSDRADGPTGYTRQLTINSLTIADGLASGGVAGGFVNGGCIDASGDVTLSGAIVSGCMAINGDPSGQANGGAIYARSLHMTNSTISNSSASALGAVGGGAYVQGTIDIRFSHVTGNYTATGNSQISPGAGGGIATFGKAGGDIQIVSSTIAGNDADFGGGLYVSSSMAAGASATAVSIDHSTVSGNHAYLSTGGVMLYDPGAHMTARIVDSTISGNNSSKFVGGAANFGAALTVSNSTIAFNGAQSSVGSPVGSGLYSNVGAVLQSSIIAKNTDYGPSDMGGGATMTGSGNLIVASVGGTVAPAGTLTADPLLGALANNGGPTFTHALLAGSPAIHGGNNLAHLGSDQRGPGFARSTAGNTDIGAFQTGDGIFYDGFD